MSTAWRDAATAWVDERLAALGSRRTGEPEQVHVRAWATVLRIPTRCGTVWFKAAGARTAFEVRMYPLLKRIVPEHILAPLATDPECGWILLPDGEPVLADRLDEISLADALEQVLPRYAELQVALAPHVDELLALGVDDMRPPVMQRRFDEALACVGDRVRDEADAELLRRVEALRPVFGEWCAELAAAPGVPSLDHNDLHPWNTFVSGPAHHLTPTFYDWGDSVVAHPFASMLIGLGFLAGRLGVGPDDARVVRVREAYLDVFDPFGSRRELERTLAVACRVSKVARALVWLRTVTTPGARVEPRFARAPFEALAGLLDASYLGRV